MKAFPQDHVGLKPALFLTGLKLPLVAIQIERDTSAILLNVT